MKLYLPVTITHFINNYHYIHVQPFMHLANIVKNLKMITCFMHSIIRLRSFFEYGLYLQTHYYYNTAGHLKFLPKTWKLHLTVSI